MPGSSWLARFVPTLSLHRVAEKEPALDPARPCQSRTLRSMLQELGLPWRLMFTQQRDKLDATPISRLAAEK